MSPNVHASPIDLSGQVAIVTGGGRGLGRAYAQALAAHGAAVAIVARSAEQVKKVAAAIHASGGQALAIVADVSDRAAVERMAADVAQRLGPVDLLVNNAGVLGPLGPFWDADPDEWWRTMEINVRSAVYCARAVIPGMVQRRRGRVDNVASAAGTGALSNVSAYGTSKTAMIRLAEVLAAEAKAYNIQAFAIHPGDVRTDMAETLLNNPNMLQWAPWFLKTYEEKRDDRAEDSIRLVLRLAAGHADALSGCYFSIRDDLDALLSRAEEVGTNRLHTLRIKTNT
jgi:NAD(P)-dependent dehydrogenase (short-subunit alcohol dehydrogenase family)